MNEASARWYIEQCTFPALLNRNAVRFGERAAQMWRGADGKVATITYAELWRVVKELASGLMALGVVKGDRVALMAHTSPDWMRTDYSILSAAGITVCIYPTQSREEMEYILNDSGSKIVFVQGEDNLEKALAVKGKVKGLEKIVMMEDEFSSSDSMVIDFKTLREMGISLLAKDKYEFEKRWRSVELTDKMTIVYTSGTTGMPKGAVHTHFSINAAANRDLRIVPEYRDDDVLMSFLPLAHTYERECGHTSAMLAAVPIAYSSPKTIVEDFQIFKPSVFMSVPRIYERVYMAMREQASKSKVKKFIFDRALATGLKVIEKRADENGFVDMSEGIDLTSGIGKWLGFKFHLYDKILFSKVRQLLGGRYRFAFSAAGSLPAELCKVFMAMGIRIIEGYGATETCNTINLNKLHRILPGSVGPVCVGVEGRVAEDGEWQVRGDNMITEYWNNPEATKDAFTADGFYKTGDIVEMLADGYIKIVDRKKGLMVLDTGKNVAANKIESKFSISRWVELVFPVGSERKYVTALVIPRFETLIDYYNTNNIPYDKSKLVFVEDPAPMCVEVGEDFIATDVLKKLVDEDIQRVNTELEEYERIKNYTILRRKLTQDDGEMTPTLKVKRKVVLDKYKDLIDAMYK